MKETINVPVVIFIFKRMDTTRLVLEQIRKVKPPRLYIVGEGHRPTVPGEDLLVKQVRDMVESSIDWDCKVFKNYVPEDIGVGARMSSGISWVFENEEQAIFLEDDIVVDKSFFFYAEELLTRYKNNQEVMMISARNSLSSDTYLIRDSYTFSSFGSIWGWASWRRAWKYYDFDMKEWPKLKGSGALRPLFNTDYAYKRMTEISFDSVVSGLNTWDYQWNFAMMSHGGLTVVPKENLMMNVGFRADGTHTMKGKNKTTSLGELHHVKFPLSHPANVERNTEYDAVYCSTHYSKPSIFQRIHIALHHMKVRILKWGVEVWKVKLS